MRIYSKGTLRDYWELHPLTFQPLNAWYEEAIKASWKKPTDIKAVYRSASFLVDNRVVFNIKGNDYRLIVKIHYNTQEIFVRFIGTHSEYDKIDATTI